MPPNWFGKLRWAFQHRAEISTAVAIFSGRTERDIAQLLSTRFNLSELNDIATMVDFARRGIQAAVDIGEQDPGSPIDPSGIPENPYLFGDDPGGRRGVIVKRVRFEDDPRWFNIHVDIADFLSPEQVAQRTQDEIQDVITRYPRAYGGRGIQPLFFQEIEWVFAERKF